MATTTGSRRSGKTAPTGRRAKADAKRKARLAKMRAKSGNRYRIHYDIDGPRVRLGIVWFLGAMVAFALGVAGTVVYFGLACAAASSHALRTWRARGHDVDPTVALVATALVVACAGFGPRALGAAVIVLAVVVVGLAFSATGGEVSAALTRAGTVLQTTLPVALAGGCVVLLADREIWSAVSLVLLVSAYETGDFLIGSGSANAFEGPLAGLAAVLVTSLVVAALGFPPFDGVAQAMAFGVAVAPLGFAGQILGSAILPHARAYAPALRRIDSLLLAAPLWYLGVDRIVLG